MSLKDIMDKAFKVDEAKIAKMAEVDIASGGQLPLLEKGESITIKFVTAPKHVLNEKLPNKEGAITARCVVHRREDGLTYDLWISSTIYKGLLTELKKAKVPVDNDLTCIVGRIFTIVGKDWHSAPKDMWKINEVTKKPESPKTYGISLRTDLEQQNVGNENVETGKQPDLMGF